MVDVGVGHHHGVNKAGGKVQLAVVPARPGLLKPAVHQHALPPHSTQWQEPVTARAAPKRSVS